MRIENLSCMLAFVLIFALAVSCIALCVALIRIYRQLAAWREALRAVKDAPERKIFVKGRGILSEINYEINDILEENRRRIRELKRAEEANQQILVNLSHDVRTPLASLLGYLEAFEHGKVKQEDEKMYISTAYGKALDLKELIDTLFDWFKIHSGEQKYDMAPCDINELTREAVIGYFPLMEQQGVTFTAEIPDGEAFVRIDRLCFIRIVGNLLRNALIHGKCSKITVCILIENENRIRIQIKNDGEAIPEEQLPCIFDRLYTGDSARTGSGNGLGLSIVKELAEAMGGEISVVSDEEETSFSLCFPLVRKK